MSAQIDVLAVLDESIRHAEERGNIERSDRLQAARAAVAELIDAAAPVSEAAVKHYGNYMGLHLELTGVGGLNERLAAALARVKGA